MIFYDNTRLPVNNHGDGMDSAFRVGILATFSNERVSLVEYLVWPSHGIVCRHPFQSPANNPWNFTRDQLIPFVSGLKSKRYYTIARAIFWEHVSRFFFCQNIERDKPGSKKYLWPHEFYKDSHPDTTTVRLHFNWKRRKWEYSILNIVAKDPNTVERKYLDFADPLLPSDTLHLLFCCNYPLINFLKPLLLPIVWSNLLFRKFEPADREENQAAVKAYVAGPIAIAIFKYVRPRWRESLLEYWDSRGEIEYAQMIINKLDKGNSNVEAHKKV